MNSRNAVVLGALLALFSSTRVRAAQEEPVEERSFPHAGNARLLSSDEAAPIKNFTLGLQRTAVPLGLGFAVDTALLADAALAANVGLRWGKAVGIHRFVIGARYTKFLGNDTVSGFINSQQPLIKSFSTNFSGPSAYALYGITLGSRLLVQVEGRYAQYQSAYATVTAAAVFNFLGALSAVVEAGVHINKPGFPLRGAAGLRYGGEHLGVSLGVAYVNLNEPLLPINDGNIPFLPAFDFSWTF